MSRIASVGLAAVLIALTLVTLWAVSVSQGVATDTAAAGVTSGDLGQLQYFIAGEQSSERDFLNRRNGSAKAFYASAAHFSRELGSLQTTGSSSGLQLASVVQVLHQRYVDSFSRYLTAARARHVTRARKIQSTSLEPTSAALSNEMNGPVARARVGAAKRAGSAQFPGRCEEYHRSGYSARRGSVVWLLARSRVV